MDKNTKKLGLRILNILWWILVIIIILHFSWILKTLINSVTNVNNLNQSETIVTKEELEENQKYTEYLKEFDTKMENLVKYYTSDWDTACSSEIKDYTNISNLNNQLWYNINYEALVDWTTDLKKVILCNIYNSTINSIYIEIPYEVVETNKVANNILTSFIDLYTEKWYEINIIYKISEEKSLKTHKNVLKFLPNFDVKSISFIYSVNTSDDLQEVYNYMNEINKFYEFNYWTRYKIFFNYWVDSKYKTFSNYQLMKLNWIKNWYNQQGFIHKERNINDLIINWKNTTQILSTEHIIQIKDDFFQSFWLQKVNMTEELHQYLKKQQDLYLENNVKWNLVFNINISKTYVDIIDWPRLYEFINFDYIKIITPNSISLTIETTYEEQVERLVKTYESKLKETDLMLVYYKYKTLFLESKTKDEK